MQRDTLLGMVLALVLSVTCGWRAQNVYEPWSGPAIFMYVCAAGFFIIALRSRNWWLKWGS